MKNLDDILDVITGNVDFKGKCEVYSEVSGDSEAKDIFKKAKITWALMSSTRKMPEYKVEESYRILHERISEKKFLLNLSFYIKYAAILVFVLGISTLTFYLGKQNSFIQDTTIKYTSIIADKGQISKVILPDSSVVWLNSDTKLTYDNNYSYINRNIQLSGQAFLDVKKNKDLPLIVASGKLRVKVLGTRFDVNAYPDEDIIKVTLESGHVELLNSGTKSFNYQLNPGQMAEFKSRSGKVEIKPVETSNYTSWKDGELIFMDTPMAEVIKQLERKFDLNIEVTDPKVFNSVFNAKFKNESLKEILDYIQFSCPVTYHLFPGKGGIRTRVTLK